MLVAILLCLATMFPIGEKDFLEPDARWPDRKQVEDDSLREVMLRNAGYADSSGKLDGKIKVWLLSECAGDTSYSLYLVNGVDGDRDDAVWLVLHEGNNILGRSMVAALQTSCESTFLRACYLKEENVIEMKQLNHVFDCGTDSFVRTDTLPTSSLKVYPDHLEDIME